MPSYLLLGEEKELLALFPELTAPNPKPVDPVSAGGQAEGAAVWTGLVPVVGQGLVFNWVRLEAPVK